MIFQTAKKTSHNSINIQHRKAFLQIELKEENVQTSQVSLRTKQLHKRECSSSFLLVTFRKAKHSNEKSLREIFYQKKRSHKESQQLVFFTCLFLSKQIVILVKDIYIFKILKSESLKFTKFKVNCNIIVKQCLFYIVYIVRSVNYV